ncbi:uncharacterized protein LOC118431836 [Branchiostoma floridae]|uniref:Uncharacterized protein LOC118431836 n=1 Tax=Branchiostoma floridae TaxID=7739 RepID=A0A9J7MD83_BRAFL|nr:uncharacterized protein LOC118431836 [Branchiostoma floridae]
MPVCVVCRNTNKNTKGISFHRFPRWEEDRLQKWLVAVRSKLRLPWTLEKIKDSIATNNNARVCSDHFSPSCCTDNQKAKYVPYKVPAKVISNDAVPTQFGLKSSRSSSECQREKRTRIQLLEDLLQPNSEQLKIPALPTSPKQSTFHCESQEPMNEAAVEAGHCGSTSGTNLSGEDPSSRLTSMFHTYSKPPCDQPPRFVNASTQTDLDGDTIASLLSTSRPKTCDTVTCTSHLPSTPKVIPRGSVSSLPSSTPILKHSDLDQSFLSSPSVVDMKDTSFHPSDFTSDSENEEEIDCGEDEGGDDGEDDFISGDDDSQYYVVHKDKIRERFKTCHCGEPLLITEQFTTGSMLTVKYECTSFHRGTWESQPKVGRMAEGNLLTSAAILFAGGSYQKFSDICNTLKLKLFSETYFMNVQRTFLLPAINDFYISQQEFTLDAFRNAGTESPEDQIQVTLLGDGRCDTPGHNAKYCSYSLMEETSQLILDFQLVQVSETTSSNAMERLGFERSLDFLEEEGIKIDCIVTDRHRGVGAVLKKRRDINHQFDLFHFAKSITKKLTQEASRRAKKDLGPWIKFIVNHLWHISDTCQGDDVVRRKLQLKKYIQ